VVSGETGGKPVLPLRTNSDTALTVVVDPHSAHDLVRQEIGSLLDKVTRDGQSMPTGAPDAGGLAYGLLKDGATAVGQLGAAALGNPGALVKAVAPSVTNALGTVVGGGGRTLGDAGLAAVKARRSFESNLATSLRSGKASPQHVVAFQSRVSYLAGRFEWARQTYGWLADPDQW
jgi:hypothetical protein